MAMWFRELRTIYWREVTHLLRDRHTVIYSVAIPLFLYPAILFVVFQALALVGGWKDQLVSSVAVEGARDREFLRHLLDEDARIELVEPPVDVEASLEAGELDVLVRLRPAAERLDTSGAAGDGREREPSGELERLVGEIVYSGARDPSVTARQRVEAVLGSYRDKLVLRHALDLGVEDQLERTLRIVEHDIASSERRANFVLSRILPLLMVVILVMGAFYPALDTAAGERERRTLETTLIAPVSRSSIVSGKYLSVCTLALIAFALNFASMAFSLKHVLLQLDVQSFRIPWTALGVVLLASTFLAGMISALMLVVAFLARSFKEGQSYLTPVYLIVVVPMVLTLSPNVTLTVGSAFIPLVNIVLLFRDVLQDRWDAGLVVCVLGSSALYTIVSIGIAARCLSREEFLLGERGRRASPENSGSLQA